MKIRTLASFAVLICFTFLNTAFAQLNISAAVSLRAVLEKAKPDLEKAVGEPIEFNFGGSGTLASQITQGAPVDLFISADRGNANKLIQNKSARAGSLKVVAGNALCIIQPKNAAIAITRFADLPKLERIAIGEPKVVPAGAYAQQTLTALNLWDPLEKAQKLVTCEDVAHVVTLVDRGEVDAGIVYRTDVAQGKNVKEVAAADPALHAPIEYVSVIVAESAHQAAAEKFQAALLSDTVQSTFKQFGFTPPPPLPPPAATTAPASAPH